MSVLFVDESKAKGYTLAAAVVVPGEMESARRNVRGLVLPGQRRIHFTKEQDARKRLILSRLIEFGFQAHVFHSSSKHASVGREETLGALIAHAVEHGHRRVVLERDDSIAQADRRFRFHEVQRHGLTGTLTYELEPPHLEPLLWVADAVAWSYSKGGEWKRRIEPLVAGITRLPA